MTSTKCRVMGASLAALVALAPFAPLAAASATPGITLAQESPDQWRASKLVGVPVYGPDNKRIGKITDVLMSQDGKAQDVIVGVGGFLGIGEKDVAVPFDAVNFSDQPITPPPSPTVAPSNNLAAPATNNAGAGGTAPLVTAGLGAPGDPLGNPSSPAMNMALPADETSASARGTAYPDHGTIAFTADQLKSAPAFQFAK